MLGLESPRKCTIFRKKCVEEADNIGYKYYIGKIAR